MKRVALLCLLTVCVGGISSCKAFPGLGLAWDLLRAIRQAPPGSEICAVFIVLEQEDDGYRVANLVNRTAQIIGSPVRLTVADADALLELSRAVNCRFLTCAAAEIKSLDPPYGDVDLRTWVRRNILLINNLVRNCPEPVTLTEDTLVALIHLIEALDL